jgi:G3E family GTPase
MFPRIRVTVLTGLPGSGKTQFLQPLLGGARGGRMALIQDDPDDLVRVLGALTERRQRVERVLLQTPDLVSPRGIVRGLFADREVRKHFVLDGVVVVADAQQLPVHLNEIPQACEQVAFADVIIINNTCLVSATELDSLERRLGAMNGLARIERALGASVSSESVLDTGRFDVTRSVDFHAALPAPRYSFEWAGLFTCEPGCYRLELQAGPAPTLDVSLLRVEDDAADAIAAATDRASYLFTTAGPVARASGQVVLSGSLYQRLLVNRGESSHFHVLLPVGGRYVLFTQYLPQEFNLTLAGLEFTDERHFALRPAHQDPVNCVRLTVHEPLHAVRFQHWLERLLRGHGGDVIRLQGCLNFAGSAEQVAIRGLHPSIDTRVIQPWGDRIRATQLVLVGRGLIQRDLLRSLRGCGA